MRFFVAFICAFYVALDGCYTAVGLHVGNDKVVVLHCMCVLFVVLVDDKYHKVHCNYNQVEHVQPQHVGDVTRQNFACNTANVSDDYHYRKYHAFARSGLGLDTFYYGNRPRKYRNIPTSLLQTIEP